MIQLIKRALRKLLGVRSPSDEWNKAMQASMREFEKGLAEGAQSAKDGKPFTGFAPKVWMRIQRSADTLTWGDDE